MSENNRTPVLKPRPYKRVEEDITFRDVRLLWPNFSGEERKFNPPGSRNFALPLDEETAVQMYNAGWAVKEKVTEDGTHLYHLKVTVKMDGKRPPRIFLITKSRNRRMQLDESTVSAVDFAQFDLLDITIRPFNYDINGKKGVSAYLKVLMGTLHEDELEKEYSHIPIEGEPEALMLENVIDAQVEQDTGWLAEPDDSKAIEAGLRALSE